MSKRVRGLPVKLAAQRLDVSLPTAYRLLSKRSADCSRGVPTQTRVVA
jgi:hypothetical protein